MGLIRLLQAIRNLTKSGAIKTIEDAYRLAKRELRERFNEYKKNIDDAFNQGKKEQTLDKRTKDIKKIDEQGIKSLDEGKFVDDKGEFTEKSKDIFKKGIEGLDVKDAGTDKDFIDFVREQGDEAGANKLQKEVDRLNKIIEDAEKGQKSIITDDKTKGVDTTVGDELFDISDTTGTFDKEREQLQDALTKLTKEKSLGTMSQEALIRSAVREFLERRVKDGSLTIPDKTDLDSIMQVRGNVDPIDIFRKAYGEDAIGGVAEIQEKFGEQLASSNFKELGDKFEKLFFRESDGGLRYNTKPKPVDKYGFDEGLISNEELADKIRKDLAEKQALEDFDITDREPNATGGRSGFSNGSPDDAVVEIDFASAEDKAFADMMKAYKYYLSIGGKKTLKEYMRMATGAGKLGGGRENFRATGGRVQAASGGIAGILKL